VPKPAEEDVPMSIVVESTAFAQDAPIPAKHTSDGDDVSPPLKWSKVPEGAKEFVLIVDDPDAPSPEPWVHWVMYKIPGSVTSLKENVEKSEQPSEPAGALQSKNSFEKVGYGGPAPPKGHGVHHYHFKVYALREPLDARPGLGKKELLELMKGRVLGQGELIGTYERKK
jgi:Raf kinase inhibitor-like YbhB/YbcL family protein